MGSRNGWRSGSILFHHCRTRGGSRRKGEPKIAQHRPAPRVCMRECHVHPPCAYLCMCVGFMRRSQDNLRVSRLILFGLPASRDSPVCLPSCCRSTQMTDSGSCIQFLCGFHQSQILMLGWQIFYLPILVPHKVLSGGGVEGRFVFEHLCPKTL